MFWPPPSARRERWAVFTSGRLERAEGAELGGVAQRAAAACGYCITLGGISRVSRAYRCPLRVNWMPSRASSGRRRRCRKRRGRHTPSREPSTVPSPSVCRLCKQQHAIEHVVENKKKKKENSSFLCIFFLFLRQESGNRRSKY